MREHFAVYVRGYFLGERYFDLPRAGRMHLSTFRERTPQRRGYEPQNLGTVDLLGPDHIEETIIEHGIRGKPEHGTVGGADRHRDKYGACLDEAAVELEPGFVAPEVLEQPTDRPQIPACPSEIRRRLGDAGRDLGIEADP